MFCSYCGNKLPSNVKFCVSCGRKAPVEELQAETTPSVAPTRDTVPSVQDVTPPASEVPQVSPPPVLEAVIEAAATSSEAQAAPGDSEPEAASDQDTPSLHTLETVVAQNTTYFTRAFATIERGEPTPFNWAAFLLGPLYCFYRRSNTSFKAYYLYPLMMMLLAPPLLIFGFSTFHTTTIVLGCILALGGGLWGLVNAVRCGKAFNRLYHAQCIDTLRREAAKEYGTSVKGVLLYCAVLFCAALLLNLISIALVDNAISSYADESGNASVDYVPEPAPEAPKAPIVEDLPSGWSYSEEVDPSGGTSSMGSFSSETSDGVPYAVSFMGQTLDEVCARFGKALRDVETDTAQGSGYLWFDDPTYPAEFCFLPFDWDLLYGTETIHYIRLIRPGVGIPITEVLSSSTTFTKLQEILDPWNLDVTYTFDGGDYGENLCQATALIGSYAVDYLWHDCPPGKTPTGPADEVLLHES